MKSGKWSIINWKETSRLSDSEYFWKEIVTVIPGSVVRIHDRIVSSTARILHEDKYNKIEDNKEEE